MEKETANYMGIPKKIHYCWFGDGEMSQLEKKCIESWKKYCPDCEIIEWNESNYDVTKNQYMYQAYENKKWGFVSDYARLDIVYQNGGVYFDTDVELIKPIDNLFQGEGFIGFEKAEQFEYKGYLVNTGQGFGAPIHNTIIKEMRDLYDSLQFVDNEGKLNLCTSPYYNTEVLVKEGLKQNNTMQKIKDIQIYPSEYFCPYSWESKKMVVTDNTYSIHHFNASWLSNKEKRIRRIERYVDSFIHLPNKMLLDILGKRRYEKLKNTLKKRV